KTIDSIEVFHKVPQKPHFQPLAEIKKEYREGSTIGMMVTFSGLFQKIAMLQFGAPRSVLYWCDIYSTLESLLDLEKYGFDVTILQDRVNELISIIDGQEQFLYQLKDVEREVMERTCQSENFDEEMKEIKKKITELK
ncbi:DUF724 domain-containing protein, partial [Cephalotus follicularis]